MARPRSPTLRSRRARAGNSSPPNAALSRSLPRSASPCTSCRHGKTARPSLHQRPTHPARPTQPRQTPHPTSWDRRPRRPHSRRCKRSWSSDNENRSNTRLAVPTCTICRAHSATLIVRSKHCRAWCRSRAGCRIFTCAGHHPAMSVTSSTAFRCRICIILPRALASFRRRSSTTWISTRARIQRAMAVLPARSSQVKWLPPPTGYAVKQPFV